MKTTIVTCDYCKERIERPLKEVNRQKKKHGENTHFYCSRACVARANHIRCRNFRAKPQNLISGSQRDQFSPFRHFIRRARRRYHECNLGLEYLKTLWDNQNGICALTGLEMCLELGVNPTRQASLDRIDSSKGYIEGNVQYVVVPINLAKGQLSDDMMKEWISDIKSVV
jgi:hypothetical protein